MGAPYYDESLAGDSPGKFNPPAGRAGIER